MHFIYSSTHRTQSCTFFFTYTCMYKLHANMFKQDTSILLYYCLLLLFEDNKILCPAWTGDRKKNGNTEDKLALIAQD